MDAEIKRLQKRNRLLMMKISGVTEMAFQARNMDATIEQSANVLSAIIASLDLPDEWWIAREFASVDTITYEAIQHYIAAKMKIFGGK